MHLRAHATSLKLFLDMAFATMRPATVHRILNVCAATTSTVCLGLFSALTRAFAYTVSNFVFYGIDDGPFYWNYKCLKASFREMLGNVCAELNEPVGLVRLDSSLGSDVG